MGEPGRCMKCNLDIIIGEPHACHPFRVALLAWVFAAGGTISHAMLRATGHAIVWCLVWHFMLRLDVAVAIGVGVRCATGGCE